VFAVKRSAWLIAWVLVGSARSRAAEASPPEPAPQVVDQPRLLLLSDEGELAFPIERAIRTELNDVEVALDVMPLVHAYDLRDRIGVAEHEVGERGALGAVWVETSEGALVVYLVVAQAGMVRRPIAGDSREAQVEAAAVVIRHFTTELLEGRSIGLTRFEDGSTEPSEPVLEGPAEVEVDEPELEPTEPDLVVPEPWRVGARGRVRIQAGYLGHAWAPQQRWASGAELSVGWRSKIGVHVGASYTVLAAYTDTISHPTDSGVAAIVVRRFSPAVFVGYQHVWDRPRLALDAHVRLITEVVERRASDPIGDRPVAIDPRLVVAPALEPRLQMDWLFRPPLSLHLALGLRINTIDYVYGLTLEDPMGNVITTREYLTPNLVAPTVQIGLGVFL
jgi:hypothetical protein